MISLPISSPNSRFNVNCLDSASIRRNRTMMLRGMYQVVSEPFDPHAALSNLEEGIHQCEKRFEKMEQQHLEVMDQLKILSSRQTASPRKGQISPPQSPSDCRLYHRGLDCKTRSDRAAEDEDESDDDQTWNRLRAAEKLSRIRQESSVTEYKQRFEKLHCLVDDVDEQSLLQTFLGGLREEIRHDVTIAEPQSLFEAFKVALRYEGKHAKLAKRGEYADLRFIAGSENQGRIQTAAGKQRRLDSEQERSHQRILCSAAPSAHEGGDASPVEDQHCDVQIQRLKTQFASMKQPNTEIINQLKLISLRLSTLSEVPVKALSTPINVPPADLQVIDEEKRRRQPQINSQDPQWQQRFTEDVQILATSPIGDPSPPNLLPTDVHHHKVREGNRSTSAAALESLKEGNRPVDSDKASDLHDSSRESVGKFGRPQGIYHHRPPENHQHQVRKHTRNSSGFSKIHCRSATKGSWRQYIRKSIDYEICDDEIHDDKEEDWEQEVRGGEVQNKENEDWEQDIAVDEDEFYSPTVDCFRHYEDEYRCLDYEEEYPLLISNSSAKCTDYDEEHPSITPNSSDPSLKSSPQLSCKASPTDVKSFFKDEMADQLLQLMQNLYLGNSEDTQEDGVCPTNSTIKLYLGKPLLGMGVEAASRKLMVHQVISLPRPRPPEPPPRTYLQLLKDVQHFIKQLELTNGNDHEVKLKRSRETSSKSMSEEVVGNPRPPPKPPWLATKRFTCWKLAEIMNFINELWQRMEKLRLPFNKQVVGVFTLSTEGAKSQRQQEGKASRTQRKEEIVKGIISNNCKAQPMKAIDQKNVQQVGFNIKGPACNATIDEEEKKQGNTAANSWVCLSAMDFLGTRRAASDEEED